MCNPCAPKHALLSVSLLLMAGVGGGIVGSGCQRPKPATSQEQPADQEQEKKDDSFKPVYAAEYVGVRGEVPFNTVTFKDVGVSGLSDTSRPLFFADVAKALAGAFEKDAETLKIEDVTFDVNPEFADPSNHLACGVNHIYVDVWRNAEKTGYSLWSGCSADDNFAWYEYPNPSQDAPQTLGEDIASTLTQAIQSGCFSLHCAPEKYRPQH